MNAEPSRHGWRVAGVSISALLLVTLGLYRGTVLYLTGLWNQLKIGEYGHGYLVLAISGYLILRNRRKLSALNPCPCYGALVAVLAASLLWMLAALVDVQMLQTVGLSLLVLALVWTVLGSRVTWRLLFPILFIGFAIPIWFPLSPVLQDLTTDAVFWAIRLVGIPAFRQDNEIMLPAGISSITEACSGLRYLLPALALGTLYGYLNYATLGARLLVVLIAAVAAILVNLLRVFIVVYLGYATEMQHPWVDDHLVLGWYLFAGMVVILLVFDALWQRGRQTAATVPATDRDEKAQRDSCPKGLPQHLATLVAGVALASAGPAAVYWVNHRPAVEKGGLVLELPSGAGGWSRPVGSSSDWMPEYRGAITRKHAYQKGGERVELYLGYYPVQRQGEELINDLNRIGNKDVWRSRNPRGRLQRAGDLVVLEQLLEKKDGARRLVWYWYRVAGRHTANEYQAKALQVLGLATGKPQAFVLAVATELKDDADHARDVLGEFVSAMKARLLEFAESGQHEELPPQD